MSQPERSELEQLFADTVYTSEYGNVHVGQELPVGVLAWMDDRKLDTLAILGAENPLGIEASAEANAAAHSRLLQELTTRELQWVESTGHCNAWSERHVFVLGCTLDSAIQLARQFSQAAIVWCVRDGLATLEWCE